MEQSKSGGAGCGIKVPHPSFLSFLGDSFGFIEANGEKQKIDYQSRGVTVFVVVEIKFLKRQEKKVRQAKEAQQQSGEKNQLQ